MLSFLRDENQTPAAAQMQNAGDSSSEEQASTSQEFLRPAVRTQTVKQGTIILAVLFLAGGVAVWWMIKKSGLSQAQGATAETSQIDQVLSQLSSFQKDMNSQMNSVSSRFSQVSELGQITVADLKKNPFRQEWSAASSGEDLSLSQTLIRKEEMRRKAATLKLWSITLREQNSCCMIGDKVLYVGDAIQGFVIKQILPDRVVLGWEDITVELKIEE
ncbi:MAG TPA: hypothetical protein P5017_10140 [Anaerohalosphaeraceae bacterium]|nr:hypothetical protein [Anaerohalosphaeraceae bacterium]